MNWIILILAGLCEVGFTYCLGRAKGVSGIEYWTWICGFSMLYVLSAIYIVDKMFLGLKDDFSFFLCIFAIE